MIVDTFSLLLHKVRAKLQSINPRGASTNNHLAIPPYPKQGLDISPWDYNDAIHLSSHSFYPSHLGFCHPWCIHVHQMA